MNWYLIWKYKSWIAIAVLLFTNFWMSVQLNKADVEKAEAVADAVAPYETAAKRQQEKINKVSADYEKLKSEQRVKNEVVIKEVQKIIERPVYRNICIDADGVSAINSLIPKNTS